MHQPSRYFVNWQQAPFYSLLLLLSWPWLLQLSTRSEQAHALLFYIAAIFLNYFSFVFSVAKGQRLNHGIAAHHAIWLFLLSNILLILVFAMGWYHFAAFGPGGMCLAKPTALDAIYFSASTFATVGYGDLLPCNSQGKMLMIAESVMGSTHFGIFITVIFSRVVFPIKLESA